MSSFKIWIDVMLQQALKVAACNYIIEESYMKDYTKYRQATTFINSDETCNELCTSTSSHHGFLQEFHQKLSALKILK